MQILATHFAPYGKNPSEFFGWSCEPLPHSLKLQTKTSTERRQTLKSAFKSSPSQQLYTKMRLQDPGRSLASASEGKDFLSLRTANSCGSYILSAWQIFRQPGSLHDRNVRKLGSVSDPDAEETSGHLQVAPYSHSGV